MRKLVVRSDDERFKGVSGIHPGSALTLGTLGSHGTWRRVLDCSQMRMSEPSPSAVPGAINWIFRGLLQNFLRGILHQSQIVALDKELMNRIRHAKNELETVVGNNIYPLKPTFVSVGADPLPDHLGNRRPYGSAIQCHRKLCTRFLASPSSQTRQFDLPQNN